MSTGNGIIILKRAKIPSIFRRFHIPKYTTPSSIRNTQNPAHMNTTNHSFFRRLTLRGAMLTSACLPLAAAPLTWNGASGTGSFTDGGNWVGSVAAPSGSDLIFDSDTGGSGGIIGFDGGITFNAPTVTFTANAPAFTLTAASASDILNITGSGTVLLNQSSFRQTSNLITVQTATQTWNGGASGLSISAIDLQNNHALTLTGTGSGLSSNEISHKITGTGNSGITKAGTGTLTFKNDLANDYTGTTTVSGGTLVMNSAAGGNIGTGAFAVDGSSSVLRLGLSDQIANASAITLLNGGTFDLAGKSETAGVLTIAAGGGIIDFGSGADTLTLAASNLASWTAPLQIKNFNTGDSLRFLGAGLTPSQLAGLKFINGSATNGSGTQAGAIDGNGFVTPTLAAVPEASTIAIGALAAFAGLSSRRRRRD